MATQPEETIPNEQREQSGIPPEFSDAEIEALINMYVKGEDANEIPAEASPETVPGETPPEAVPTTEQPAEASAESAVQPPEEQPAAPEGEQAPEAANQPEEVGADAEQEAMVQAFNETVQSLVNELSTEMGTEVNPELVGRIYLKTLQKAEANTQETEGEPMTERERALAEDLKRERLLRDAGDIEKMPDYEEHKEDMKKYLADKKEPYVGMHKEAYEKARAQKYQSPKAVLENALKDEATLAELAKNPALKKKVAEIIMAEMRESNGEIPQIAPQTGAPYQEPPVGKPEGWDEAEKRAQARINKVKQGK